VRTWREGQQQPSVLAVAQTHPVWMAGRAQPVGLVAALVPEGAWTPLSAGAGSQGPRLYTWAWLEVDAEVDAEPASRGGWRSWILMRRSLSQPSERASSRVWGPPPTTLAELVRVAGRRWTIEAGLEEAKGAVGLDPYEVRSWTGWYRHITLALLAHAVLVVLVVLRAQAWQEGQNEEGQKGGDADEEVRLSVAELRRLLPALQESEEHREQRLWWSRFRRRHQASAQRSHVARRARQAPRARPPGPPPLRVPSLPEVTPARWAQIFPLLPRSRLGRPASDHRLMGEGILWVMRTGGSWRALPERFAPWSTVAGCSHRWRHAGIWERIRQVLLPPDVPFSSSA